MIFKCLTKFLFKNKNYIQNIYLIVVLIELKDDCVSKHSSMSYIDVIKNHIQNIYLIQILIELN